MLEVEDLKTYFHTDAGIVRAVNGVTLRIRDGETLAIVGESGSGKSVTGLTIMRLLGRTRGRVEGGKIRFRERSGKTVDLLSLTDAEMARIRGREVAMIFQDPMSSLNPVFSIGEQIAEPIRIHRNASRKEAAQEAVELLRQVGIADPEIPGRQLPASALGRNAPARDDRDRPGLRPPGSSSPTNPPPRWT